MMCIIEISALKLWDYDYVVIRHRQLRLQLKRYNKVAAWRRAATFLLTKRDICDIIFKNRWRYNMEMHSR